MSTLIIFFFFFQAEDGIRDHCVTGVQTCALPISVGHRGPSPRRAARPASGCGQDGHGGRRGLAVGCRSGTAGSRCPCGRAQSRRCSFLPLQLKRGILFHHKHDATRPSPARTSENSVPANFGEFHTGEVRRIRLLRTRVNKSLTRTLTRKHSEAERSKGDATLSDELHAEHREGRGNVEAERFWEDHYHRRERVWSG